MGKTTSRGLTRRHLLQAGLAAGAGAALWPLGQARAQAADRKFLIVITATGGASVLDFGLVTPESLCADAAVLNAYPDQQVQQLEGSPFRFMDQQLRDLGPLPYEGPANHSDFVRRHAQDMLIVTHTGTSVNHQVAQKRSLTGNDAWGGRTLQEAVAAAFGEGLPLPNVNMGSAGYIEPGIDATIPGWARHEPVVDARFWPLGLDGVQGIQGVPGKDLVALARRVRDEHLDPGTEFTRTFGRSAALQRWLRQRGTQQPALEAAGLLDRLNIIPDQPGVPISQFGIGQAPEAAQLRETFPLYFSDPLEGQAALAFLLLKNRVSNVVTLGPNLSPLVGGQQIVDSPPLAFDFSHTSHRGTQALMWSRLLSVMDRLIGLLKATEYGGGESMWDRSLIYVATEFGRTRNRAANAGDFGSGHHLNNGSLIVSPMVRGNTVLGGVDPNTLMTYGFDPQTGAPDPGRHMAEAHVFSGILQAVGVDTSAAGLPDMRAMRPA